MLVPTKKSVFGERVRRSATSSSRETAAGTNGSSGVQSLSGGGGASGSLESDPAALALLPPLLPSPLPGRGAPERLGSGGVASGSAVQCNSELLEKIDIKMEFAPMKRQVKELCPELSEIEKDGLHLLYAVLVHFNQRFVRHVSHSAHNEQVRIVTLEWLREKAQEAYGLIH